MDAADAAGGADQLPERSLLLFADLVEVGELVTEDRVRDAINRRDRDTRSVAERAAASAREVDVAFCREEHAAAIGAPFRVSPTMTPNSSSPLA